MILSGISSLSGVTSLNQGVVTQAFSLSDNSATLTWTKAPGSTRTYIVMKEGSVPANATDGTVVYNDTGTSCKVNHLLPANTYHFAFYSNSPSYSFGSETEETVTYKPNGISATEQYVFVCTHDAAAVHVYNKDDIGTIVATLTPSVSSGTRTHAVSARGNNVAFGGEGYLYLFEFIDENNFTERIAHTTDTTGKFIRACHIDQEEEYAYYGDEEGNIYWYRLSDLTKYTDFTTFVEGTGQNGTDNIRGFETNGDDMYLAHNNDSVYHIDRSDRTDITTNTEINDYGSNMENVSHDGTYLYTGGDNQEVEVRNPTTPFAIVDTMTNPTNDVTSISVDDSDYMAATDDSGNVFVFNKNDSYNLLNSTSKTHGMEGSAMFNGTLIYGGGTEGVSAKKMYSRSYLSNSLSSNPFYLGRTE